MTELNWCRFIVQVDQQLDWFTAEYISLFTAKVFFETYTFFHTVANFFLYFGSVSVSIKSSALVLRASSWVTSYRLRRPIRMSYRMRVQFFSTAHSWKRFSNPFIT